MTAPMHAQRSIPAPVSRIADSVELNYGPIPLLGRYLIEAETQVSLKGVNLTLASAEQLLQANQDNGESWLPVVGVFDQRNGGIDDKNFFAILGTSETGEVVAAGAAHYYYWPDSSFREELQSLRLFYSEPERMKLRGETAMVSAASAARVKGRVVFSGAAWYHPDYRGLGLSAIIPRMVKAISIGRWNPDYIVSMMSEKVHSRGFMKMLSYTNIDWRIEMRNSSIGDANLAFVWMTGEDAAKDVEASLAGQSAKIDRGIVNRSA